MADRTIPAFKILRGNVGINTTTPTEKLYVDGAGYFEGGGTRDGGWNRALEITTENANFSSLYFGGQATNKYSGIIWTSTTSGNTPASRGGQIYTQPTSATNSDIRFDTNNAVGSSSPTTKMVIRGDGKVGIGTDGPGTLLTISGNSDDGDNACGLAINDEDSTVGSKLPAVFFYGGGTMQGRIRGGDATFSIAVGSSPSTALSINTTSTNVSVGSTSSVYGRLFVDATSTPNSAAALAVRGRDSSASYIALNVMNNADGTLFSILNSGKAYFSGNVGIGTATPGSLLEIYENDSNEGNTQLHIHNDKNDDAAVIKLEGKRTSSNDTAQVVFANSGNAIAAIKALTAGADDGLITFSTSAAGSGSTLTEYMRLSSDGNVGIGTVAPAAHLHVSKAAGTTTVLTQVAANSTVGFEIKKTGSTTQHWKIVDGQTVNGTLEFYDATDSATRMVINGNGNVGIGENNPDKPLHIKGTNTAGIVIENTTNATNMDIDWYNNGGSVAGRIRYSEGTGDFSFMPNQSTNAVVFRYNGNVGINTSSPSAKLHIESDGSHDEGAEIVLKHANNNSTDVVSTLSFQNNAGQVAMIQAGTTGANNTGYISFFTDNAGTSSEKVRIIGDGKVGIGLTLPVNRLQVMPFTSGGNSSNASEDAAYFGGNELGGIGGYTGIRLGGYGSSGYGTYIRSVKTSAYGGYWNEAITFSVTRTGTSSTVDEAVRINSDGNVGIGTNNPAGKLDVGGDTDAFGFIGRARIGYLGHADIAGFCHRDMASTVNYALIQSASGHTYVNAASGQQISFRIANSDTMYMSNTALQFNDNKKVILGNDSDLQLFHDGSNSYIQNGSTGSLNVTLNAGGEFAARFVKDAAVELYYNGTKTFETVSNGVKINISAGYLFGGDGEILAGQDTGGYYFATGAGQNVSKPVFIGDNATYIKMKVGDTERFRVTTSGITVTGDAIIGSAATKLKTYSDSTYSGIYNGSSLGSDEAIYFGAGVTYFYNDGATSLVIAANKRVQLQATDYQMQYTSGSHIWFTRLQSNGTFAIHKNGVGDFLSIDSAGKVGIGTGSPSAPLEVYYSGDSSVPGIIVRNTTNATTSSILFEDDGGTRKWACGYNDATNDWRVSQSSGSSSGNLEYPKLVVANGGNVGIGVAIPTNKLQVKDATDISPTSGAAGQFAVQGNGYTTFLAMDGTAAYFGHNSSGRSLVLMTNETARLTITGSGNVGVAGSFSASSKSFLIDHPTKENKKLEHGCLEGPEFGVYYRGRIQANTISLPDYWTGLVREDSITVQLTPRGGFQHLYVVSTSLSEIVIGAADGEVIDCFYTIYGERADIDSLVVEKNV